MLLSTHSSICIFSQLICVYMHHTQPMICPLEHVPEGVLQSLCLDLAGQSDIRHLLLCERVQGATLLHMLLPCSHRVAPLTQVIAGNTLGTVVATLAILYVQKWIVLGAYRTLQHNPFVQLDLKGWNWAYLRGMAPELLMYCN